MLCPSNLLILSLVLIILLHDIYNKRYRYLVEHSILGGIVAVLFYTMCNYGLERVNWGLLACIPIIMFIKWVYTPPPYYDENGESVNDCQECNECNGPVNASGAINAIDYITSKKTRKIWESSNKKELNCPARPINLPTECGISRYY